MAFIQPCLIRLNYKYIREDLRKLGYKFNKPRHYLYVEGNMLLCNNGKYSIECNLSRVVLDNGLEVIDCDKNVDLFLALAALRDDSDRNQWFIHDTMDCVVEGMRHIDWIKCEDDKIEDFMIYDCAYLNCRKATVDELIKHFSHEE